MSFFAPLEKPWLSFSVSVGEYSCNMRYMAMVLNKVTFVMEREWGLLLSDEAVRVYKLRQWAE